MPAEERPRATVEDSMTAAAAAATTTTTTTTGAALLLLALVRAGLACYQWPTPPNIIFPAQRRIQIKLGDTFTLKCQNYFPLKWMTPGNSQDRTNEEQVNLFADKHVSVDLYESTFTRSAASYEDTGYYHCVQQSKSLQDKYSSDNVYVHVSGTPSTTTEAPSGNNAIKPLKRVSLVHEFKEDHLEITCRALLEEGTTYHMFWQGPSRLARKNGQIHLQRLPLEQQTGKIVAVHKLTVLNVADQNNGQYKCTTVYGTGEEDSASLLLSGHDVQLLNSNTVHNETSKQP